MTSISVDFKENNKKAKRIIWVTFLTFDFLNIVSHTQMSDQLAKRGYDVYLIGMKSKRIKLTKPFTYNLILLPIRYLPYISPIIYLLILSLYMPFFVIYKRPCYVILEPGTYLIGLILTFLKKIIKLIIVLDVRTTPIKINNNLRTSFLFKTFRLSIVIAKKKYDGITILTQLMKKKIAADFNIDEKFIGVWTSGVASEIFDPSRYNGQIIKRNLGLEDKFVIFHHGVLEAGRTEGIVEAIKSLEFLKNQYKNLILFILGEGKALSIINKAIKENNVEEIVKIHSWVNYPEVPKYISICDVAIVPLPYTENWKYQCPLKILEYLAMEKVVIVTDMPGIKEILDDNRCGIYTSTINHNEISKAIAYVYDNQEKIQSWGSIGRNIIQKKYTWVKVADDFERFLLSLNFTKNLKVSC